MRRYSDALEPDRDRASQSRDTKCLLFIRQLIHIQRSVQTGADLLRLTLLQIQSVNNTHSNNTQHTKLFIALITVICTLHRRIIMLAYKQTSDGSDVQWREFESYKVLQNQVELLFVVFVRLSHVTDLIST